jgi:hypothetical protein
MVWTTQQVEAMAPDPESVRAGKGLADARHWVSRGANEEVVWGECKGSGSKPYQVRVDLGNGGTKCSCPSRKFPCKHALGALFLRAAKPELFAADPVPGWVTEWLQGRQERAEKKAANADKRAVVDTSPEAQAQREERRVADAEPALEILHLWLKDLVGRGLDWARQQPGSYWDGMQRRLVDAKATGLAGMVVKLGEAAASGKEWDRRMAEYLGRITLLSQAIRRLDTLTPEMQADVHGALGTTMRMEQVLATGEAIDDRWHMLGYVLADAEGPVRTQRQWLRGQSSGRDLLLLSFAHRSAPLPPVHAIGGTLTGAAAFYPGSVPLRGLMKGTPQESLESLGTAPAGDSIGGALEKCLRRAAQCPWVETQPMVLADCRIVPDGDKVYVVDSHRATLPVLLPEDRLWPLLAFSAGHECTLMAEWTGEHLRPLTAWRGGKLLHLKVELS